MGRRWTKAQREQQSRRVKAYWARRKQAEMTVWQRIKNLIGLN